MNPPSGIVRLSRNRLSLSFTSLAYTIAFTIIVQMIFVLFAVAAIQRTQFESLANFYVGVLVASYGQGIGQSPGPDEMVLCSDDVVPDISLINLLDQGLHYPGNSGTDRSGIITLAYNCGTKKLTRLDSADLPTDTQGPRIELASGGILSDIMTSLRLVWLLFTNGQSNIYTIEQFMDGDASVLLSFDRTYLSDLLVGHLRQYFLVATTLILMNVLFVFILVRNFIAAPIRHMTNSLQSLLCDRYLQLGPARARHGQGFQFREIHAANSALASINEQLEPRRVIENRKDGIDHEIRNDLQRLYGQIYAARLPERMEQLLKLLLDRMGNRFSDIMTFVTWRKAGLERETVNLAGIVDTCSELTIGISRLAGEGGRCPQLVSRVPADLVVLANANGLRIVLENIFRNAVEAFRTGSKAELRDSILMQLHEEGVPEEVTSDWARTMSPGQDDDHRMITLVACAENGIARITISDNADGIETGLRGRIFIRGVTAKGEDKARHGIGLLFARMLVEELGGEVRMTWTRHRDDIRRDLHDALQGNGARVDASILETGTTFEVVLPLATETG